VKARNIYALGGKRSVMKLWHRRGGGKLYRGCPREDDKIRIKKNEETGTGKKETKLPKLERGVGRSVVGIWGILQGRAKNHNSLGGRGLKKKKPSAGGRGEQTLPLPGEKHVGKREKAKVTRQREKKTNGERSGCGVIRGAARMAPQ